MTALPAKRRLKAVVPLECEFIIQQPAAVNDLYRILALTPAGPAEGRLKFNVPAAELARLLAGVREDTPDLAIRRKFGQVLFQALVPEGSIRDAWSNTQGRLTPGTAL